MNPQFSWHVRWSRRVFTRTVICVWWCIVLGAVPARGQTPPYRTLSEAGAGFFGQGREALAPDSVDTVRIGLTGPERTPQGRHLRCGVALAIEEANARGGYRGLKAYEIVFRPDDGPWGTAAKQVVRLTYEDEVWAILGSLDGGHAHLAELIAAKAWIPVVTPCASDRTIDYANVPWMFRCTPDDGQQAVALVRYVRDQGFKRTIALTAGERESRRGWERLQDAARGERHRFALHVEFDPHDPIAVLPRLVNAAGDSFIIWGDPEGVVPLIRALRGLGIDAPVLGPSLLATPELADGARGLGEIVVVAPFNLGRDSRELREFNRRYVQLTGVPPSPVALYAYDATRMVQAAIEKAGLNRARIRDELARMSFTGLVGEIRFDDLGGNPAQPTLVAPRSGEWAPLGGR
jgi:branched-chain amino acid transport system substrate-binding protein